MSPSLTFKPVTGKTVGDFKALFETRGAPGYCWCMAWRATPDERRSAKGPERRKQILARIADAVPVGLVAFDGQEPVGWVSVAPKSTFRGLGGVDDDGHVWSLTCLFILRTHRGQGLSAQMIQAAIGHARKHGGRLLEAYPVDPDSPSYRHMGFVPAFERAGFSPFGREGTRRHVMHKPL